jgi:hypothetical protein
LEECGNEIASENAIENNDVHEEILNEIEDDSFYDEASEIEIDNDRRHRHHDEIDLIDVHAIQ